MTKAETIRNHIFVSYSHQDLFWLERLNVHLKPLVREHGLDVWSDQKINPGDNWKKKIDLAISQARVAILLISADFLASDFIIENELPPLLEKAKIEGALILPIVVSPCRFLETKELARFQSVNEPTRSLLSMSRAEQEHVFLNLAKRIEKKLQEISYKKSSRKTLSSGNEKKIVEKNIGPIIKAIGIGGGGCNAINYMAKQRLSGVETICANSDVQALSGMSANILLQIGRDITRGLGAGANPEVGYQSAKESENEIREAIKNADLLFIAVGMGGGTGTGGAQVVAKIAKELDILTIAVVTKPFGFEGRKRLNIAEDGIRKLSQYADSLIVLPNQRIFAAVDSKESLIEAFARVNEVLRWVVQGISYLLVQPGVINVDFADLRTVMKGKGFAKMGTGIISKSTATGEDAAISALDNPLTEPLSPQGEQRILVNIVGGEDLTVGDINSVGKAIRERFSEETIIILGTAITDELKGEIRVTVVATGYKETENANKIF